VLAVVAAGLYFGRYGSVSLTAGARLQQREIWDLIVFLLTGMSFLLVGLELRPILDSLVNRESGSLAIEALAVVGAVVVVRMAWMFGTTALPGGERLFASGDRPSRSWRETTVVGWAGMRGAVSLAASLALPQNFPQRDLLVFLTFAVIVATLVGQGLTLPPLIRQLGLVTRDEQDAVLVAEARRRLTVLALCRLDELTGDERFAPEVAMRIRVGYESQLARIDRRLEGLRAGVSQQEGGEGGADDDTDGHLRAESELRKLVIDSERTELGRLVARRKVSERVAGEVRAALDVDEITMRP
jgi:CPA1 family monovalent cation:H+ antiporter